MIPDVLKWQKGRATWLNLLCIVCALALIVFESAMFVLSAFVGAIFSLALGK